MECQACKDRGETCYPCLSAQRQRLEAELSDLRAATYAAIDVIDRFGGIDGAHHKQWVLDQAMRYLLGPAYPDWIRNAEAKGYTWDEGVIP